MKNTNNKKEYRRLLAILQQVEGKYYEDIANEHGVRQQAGKGGLLCFVAQNHYHIGMSLFTN